MATKDPNIFDQLQDETRTLQDNCTQLQEKFDKLSKSNGAGEPVRRKLKRKLTKPAFIKTLHTQ